MVSGRHSDCPESDAEAKSDGVGGLGSSKPLESAKRATSNHLQPTKDMSRAAVVEARKVVDLKASQGALCEADSPSNYEWVKRPPGGWGAADLGPDKGLLQCLVPGNLTFFGPKPLHALRLGSQPGEVNFGVLAPDILTNGPVN